MMSHMYQSTDGTTYVRNNSTSSESGGDGTWARTYADPVPLCPVDAVEIDAPQGEPDVTFYLPISKWLASDAIKNTAGRGRWARIEFMSGSQVLGFLRFTTHGNGGSAGATQVSRQYLLSPDGTALLVLVSEMENIPTVGMVQQQGKDIMQLCYARGRNKKNTLLRKQPTIAFKVFLGDIEHEGNFSARICVKAKGESIRVPMVQLGESPTDELTDIDLHDEKFDSSEMKSSGDSYTHHHAEGQSFSGSQEGFQSHAVFEEPEQQEGQLREISSDDESPSEDDEDFNDENEHHSFSRPVVYHNQMEGKPSISQDGAGQDDESVSGDFRSRMRASLQQFASYATKPNPSFLSGLQLGPSSPSVTPRLLHNPSSDTTDVFCQSTPLVVQENVEGKNWGFSMKPAGNIGFLPLQRSYSARSHGDSETRMPLDLDLQDNDARLGLFPSGDRISMSGDSANWDAMSDVRSEFSAGELLGFNDSESAGMGGITREISWCVEEENQF